MSIVQLKIAYDDLLELIQQLPEDRQDDLIQQLLLDRAQRRPLTIEEKIKLFDSAKIKTPVNEEPSVRRVDWYDDDGR